MRMKSNHDLSRIPGSFFNPLTPSIVLKQAGSASVKIKERTRDARSPD